MKKNLIVQFANSSTWYLGEKKYKKTKRQKTNVLLENNQAARMSKDKTSAGRII